LSGGISEADLSRAWRDTPGCEEVLHFNNTEEEVSLFCETLERIL
jgi:hypothetical protein